jgi:hypothetical protein
VSAANIDDFRKTTFEDETMEELMDLLEGAGIPKEQIILWKY